MINRGLLPLSFVGLSLFVAACSIENTSNTPNITDAHHFLSQPATVDFAKMAADAPDVFTHMSGRTIASDHVEAIPRWQFGHGGQEKAETESLTTGYDQAGQLQERIKASRQPLGFLVYQTVYPTTFNLGTPQPLITPYPTSYPTNLPYGNLLLAPTTRTISSCLEVGQYYYRARNKATTLMETYVYDFCHSPNQYYFWKWGSGNIPNAQLDPKQYAAGAPYATEPYIVQFDVLRQADGSWLAVIYNVTTGLYDKLLSTETDPTQIPVMGSDGWNMFETHYLPGPCPSTPAITSSLAGLYVTPAPTPTPQPLESASPYVPTASPSPIETSAAYVRQNLALVSPAPSDIYYTTTTHNDCLINQNPGNGAYYTFQTAEPTLWTIISNPS